MSAIHPPVAGDAAAALYSKLNWRLLPFLVACYMFAYLDRVNVGFAKLQMQSDLGFSDAAYGVGAGIFFIGYVLFELPSNLMLPKVGARRTFSRILVLWGVTSACMLFVRNVPAFYAMRFLLGVFEAGFAPGMIYYLSCWYGPARMARAIALVFVAGPLGGIVGGPVSTWLMTSLSGVGGLAGWQWMFLVEGLPCVVLGLLTLRVLSDKPADARWLNSDEKGILASETAPASHHADSFKAVLRSPRVYVLALAYFSIIFPIYAISFWLPTLLKEQGVTDTLRLGWYTAIPYVAAAVCMYAAGRRSDRVGERRYHCAVPALGAAVFLSAAVVADAHFVLMLLALTLGTACLWMAYTVFWAIPSELVKGAAAAGGIALINTVGLSGGFWGPAVFGWTKAASGSTHAGLFVMAGAAALAAVLISKGKLTLKQD
ncbi:MFS transporter [Paraburkholderia phenoliruptrix]|uniref:Major facilitator superfamily protein n=2 Tax=Paraburkholderia phenoliruptrix TaxID=252970 RepID=K0DQK9_9BURK|nr:MFS transporter [Paraburkholderia phenoliruptrix]AFT88436.1 major facilitator superfamily protein [Paraburkholderia phenoliruptrix BR3459a]MDR6418695.1 sugar phosphate permease [Paraburkholderia phenoliruptrix]CAB4047364.1 Putative metabolite transport protein NicT [Paraburkholderia phenoliruptrix]